jgi:FkbM family methyltransferase
MFSFIIVIFLRFFALIPLKISLRFAQFFMASKGYGWGKSVSNSGERRGLRKILRNITGSPVVFDVGANLGIYTKTVFEIRADSNLFVFEPAQKTFEKLSRNLNNGKYAQGKFKLFNCALGNETGMATLYSDKDLSELASLTKRNLSHVKMEMAMKEEVKIRTIDEIFSDEKLTKIDLLKLDVEGHELDVLRGAAGCFEQKKIDVVQFEFGASNIDTRTYFRDYFNFFKEKKFKIFVIGIGGISSIDKYNDIYEYFKTTNYFAFRYE